MCYPTLWLVEAGGLGVKVIKKKKFGNCFKIQYEYVIPFLLTFWHVLYRVGGEKQRERERWMHVL